MSQFGQRGGQHFSKMSEIQKCPKCRRGEGGGGGSTLIGTCPKFSRFSILTPPLIPEDEPEKCAYYKFISVISVISPIFSKVFVHRTGCPCNGDICM